MIERSATANRATRRFLEKSFVERPLGEPSGLSNGVMSGFFEALEQTDSELQGAIDELLIGVRARRVFTIAFAAPD